MKVLDPGFMKPVTLKFVKDIVMGCGGRPNHQQHYVKSLFAATTFFGQHHDIFLLFNIFYNTTSKYINPDTCIGQWKKLAHQSKVH
jgi:hypothetical protein